MAFNASATSGAAAPVSVTITGISGLTARVYAVDAWTSAGTSQLTITDGGVTRWLSPATWITTALTSKVWTPIALVADTPGNTLVVTASSAGGGNTVTINVQADNV